MNNIKISTARFEHKSSDKDYNLSVIAALSKKAAEAGANAVAFGDILAECRTFDDSIVTATITPEKLQQAGGHRYLKARRPELYREILGQDHKPELKVVWLDGK